MYLAIERNRLKDRFEGTVTTAILEVLDKETNEEHLESISRVLNKFNDVIKLVDESTGLKRDDDEWKTYEEESHEMYINILLKQLNNLYTQTSHVKNGIRTLKNQYFSPQNILMRLFLSVPMRPACILGDAEQSWL